MKKLPLFIAFIAAVCVLVPLAHAQGTVVGNIKILEVKGGSALVIKPDGVSSPANTGEFIQQGASVKTGSGSSVSLLFDNGALVVVQPNSELSVDQFTTDPFNYDGIDYKTLSKEPSKSVTKLMVKDGLVAVDVVPLNGKSKFDVATPVGSAGIRGTRFAVQFSKATNSAGVVVVIGSVSVAGPNGQMQVVAAGMGIGIGPGGLQAATQQAVASLIQQVNQLIQASRATIQSDSFANSPSQTSTGGGTPLTPGDPGSTNAGQTIPGSGNRPSGG